MYLKYYLNETKLNNYTLTNKEISELVESRLSEKRLTIRACVELYNSKRQRSESLKHLPALNKDFVCRVKNNNFDVANERVAKLCDFLGINLTPVAEGKGLSYKMNTKKLIKF